MTMNSPRDSTTRPHPAVPAHTVVSAPQALVCLGGSGSGSGSARLTTTVHGPAVGALSDPFVACVPWTVVDGAPSN